MKILTAMFRARDDGTVMSNYRAQCEADDVPKLLRAIRDDIDAELEKISRCPARRTQTQG
jgi:hypothetical protein